MTGYAVATSEGAAGTLTIEIKSVNSRFLDLQFRINDELRALEPDLRAAIMAAITRGKVEARLSSAARSPAARRRSTPRCWPTWRACRRKSAAHFVVGARR